jgi:hypothetical protein
MKKPPEKLPITNLRDAYKVAGFRVLAKIASQGQDPPAFVLTLDRRSKKPSAAAAGNDAAATTTSAGGAPAISVAATGRSISIFRCAA